MVTDLLTGKELSVFRGERLVLRGVSLAVTAGGALVLRGDNGTGKSTLLRTLAGLTPLAAGQILWNGAPALADFPSHAARIAWLGHLDAVKPSLSVAEHVADQGALVAVGLERFAALPARFLSAGQRRRLALARVAASGRPLWLLDEPTTGLDATSVARFAALCAQHRAAGGMIITSTHMALDLPGAEVLAL
ncbi:heme ABC exporter ATP-binding protein CcmA [Acidocella sp.]|uniref:heme ABC exporter ATP-binding protein CcmA n=1 Tax=Acidocella sp. TaxID=50710 RepID=UPI0038D15C8D